MKIKPARGGERAAEVGRARRDGRDRAASSSVVPSGASHRILRLARSTAVEHAPGRRVAGQSERREQQLALHAVGRAALRRDLLVGEALLHLGVIGGRKERDPVHEVRAVDVDDGLAGVEGEAAPVRAAAGERDDQRAVQARRGEEALAARRAIALAHAPRSQGVSPQACSGVMRSGPSGGGATGNGCVGDSASPGRRPAARGAPRPGGPARRCRGRARRCRPCFVACDDDVARLPVDAMVASVGWAGMS